MPTWPDGTHAPTLAGGPEGPRHLRPLLDTVLDALAAGAADRGGPLPAGGPKAVADRVRSAAEPLIPETGVGAHEALRDLVHAVTAGTAEPADPRCAAHLHGPPLAVAAAADLAASALNPSMDSWDQAPAASTLEARVTRGLAAEIYPHEPTADGLITTGGTEANQLALLLEREAGKPAGPVQVVCGANAHHSIRRAAWLLGLPEPLVLPTPADILNPAGLDAALKDLRGPCLVVATAGTIDTGAIDPLPQIADICAAHGARLHVDAAYGGPLLFSDTLKVRLDGLERADSVGLDLHKFGWQPIAAGIFAVRDRALLRPLGHHEDHLNPEDDAAAGIPDVLGRSLRSTRRADVLKIAVTLRAIGRRGLAELVNRTCTAAHRFADIVAAHPAFELYEPPTLSTVLFRPLGADDASVADIRRRLLAAGSAVLGRAHAADPHTGTVRLWLKAAVLNPHTRPADLETLLKIVEGSTPR